MPRTRFLKADAREALDGLTLDWLLLHSYGLLTKWRP